jgi:hypothetical protein
MKKICIVIPFVFSSLFGFSQSTLPDTSKRAYTIFNPTPKSRLREMETDRPDVTESAISVDAGHFQVESDAYRVSFNKSNGVKTRESAFNLANLKIGLTNSMDLQLVVPFYLQEKNTAIDGQSEKKSGGFNDFTLRLKKNIWGNDQGRTALAVMPFVNIQTGKDAEDKRPEGGVVIPFSAELAETWSFGAQGQISFLRAENKKYESEQLSSVTVGKTFSETSSAFVESHYTYNFNQKQFDLYFNGGFIYSFTDNFRMDLGFNYGLTKGSDKVYFIGYSFRY